MIFPSLQTVGIPHCFTIPPIPQVLHMFNSKRGEEKQRERKKEFKIMRKKKIKQKWKRNEKQKQMTRKTE